MKKIIDTADGGMESLLGEVITVFCCRYIYTGTLVGVDDISIQLKNPKIVYETGPFTSPEWKDAQALPKPDIYIMLSSIECFGLMK